ncbi:MAG: PocR ligand-binding domain-containing protein, partial [Desulfobacterales bacterium]
MGRKPKYEKLKNRIKELEQDALGRIKVEKTLKPNTEQIDFSNTELENPHLIDGKYSITDLVDIELLHKALEKFSLASGFTAGMLEYPSRNILISTGLRNICTKFHRASPKSEEICRNSNIQLTEHSKELQELSIKTCRHGLVDGVTPIIIRGKNIAYLITGQIFFEKPDIKRFKKQAKMYGYDLEAYLEALSEVPVVSEDQFKYALSFLKELSTIIAEIGLKNLELKENTKELGIEKSNLKEANIALQVLLDKRQEDKKETADNLLTNLKELIAPYLEKIKKTKLDDQQKAILSIIESNINEIASPFTRKMSRTYLNLTPTEIKVANLIRHGSSAKEIAELMSLSPQTIYNHRKKIRKKLGIENKKTDLRSYLLS